jgi:hypothetical protein
MGHDIAISGRLAFPPRRRDALRALLVDARTFDDWPEGGLFDAGAGVPATVEEVLSRFHTEKRAEVSWAQDGLRVAMIVPASAERWVRGGRNLLALFRLAGAAGAQGGVAITSYAGVTTTDVLSINTKGDGSSSLSVLSGVPAERAALAIHKLVDHLAVDGSA